MNKFLFKHIDNSALIVFRIIFGLLIFLESVGAIFTGWIKRTLIEPEFTFTFIGFEWLQPLPGDWMYLYYAIMGGFGLLVMVGYKYKWSMLAFTLLWSATYFMQKSSYNNHYYLLILLSAIMVFQPANRYASIDVKQNPEIKSHSMPQWCRLVFILQMFIVYSYASVAKLYPDWLDLSFPELLLKSKQHYMLIGEFLQQKWMLYFVAYGGILFDGLIVPLLLWKRTRKLAFFASVFFHVFNSIIFQVGIFPYLSLAFTLFFFEPKTIQKLFLKKKPFYDQSDLKIPNRSTFYVALFSLYFVIQLLLPLRHHLIQDNVLWTEEGHRLSWRMMLRSKGGTIHYKVIDETSAAIIPIKLDDYLTKKQQRGASTKPDVIWQFAQHLKQEFAKKGMVIKVFVDCKVSVNGKASRRLIDPDIDLAKVEWNSFSHNDWVLPSKQETTTSKQLRRTQ